MISKVGPRSPLRAWADVTAAVIPPDSIRGGQRTARPTSTRKFSVSNLQPIILNSAASPVMLFLGAQRLLIAFQSFVKAFHPIEKPTFVQVGDRQ